MDANCYIYPISDDLLTSQLKSTIIHNDGAPCSVLTGVSGDGEVQGGLTIQADPAHRGHPAMVPHSSPLPLQIFKNVVVSHKALIEAEIEEQKKQIIGGLETFIDWRLKDKSSLHRPQLAEIPESQNTDSTKRFLVFFQLLQSKVNQVDIVALQH